MNVGGYHGATTGQKLVLDDLMLEVCLGGSLIEDIGLYVVRIAEVGQTSLILDNSVIHARSQVVIISEVDHTHLLPVLSGRIEDIRGHPERILQNSLRIAPSITPHYGIQPEVRRGCHLVTQQKTTKPKG